MNALKRTGLAVKAGVYAATHAVKSTFTQSDSPRTVFDYHYRRLMWSWGAWSYRKLSDLAVRNPHSSRGLRLLSQAMASVPLVVQKRQGNEWEAVEDGDTSILDLFERPNPSTGKRRFIDKIIYGIHCGGEFWLEKKGPTTGPNAGDVRRMRIITPDEFQSFIRDRQTGEVTGYTFSNLHRRGTTYERTTDEVIHIRTFNPNDPDRGLPILVAGMALKQMKAAQEWNTNIAQGGGRVPGYWTPSKGWMEATGGSALSPEQVQEVQEDMDERIIERSHMDLDMVLSGDFERVKGDVSPKDADWIKGQELSIRQIATLLGIPHTLLGAEKAGSLTDAGVDSEVRTLMLLTVLPMLEWILDEISAYLLPDGQRLYYNRDQIEALQEDVNGMWKRYGEAYAVYQTISREEARAALGFEEEPSESGEEPEPQGDTSIEESEGDGSLRSLPTLDVKKLLEPDRDPMHDVQEALAARFGEAA